MHADLLALDIRARKMRTPRRMRLVRALWELAYVREYRAAGAYADALRCLQEAKRQVALYEAGV